MTYKHGFPSLLTALYGIFALARPMDAQSDGDLGHLGTWCRVAWVWCSVCRGVLSDCYPHECQGVTGGRVVPGQCMFCDNKMGKTLDVYIVFGWCARAAAWEKALTGTIKSQSLKQSDDIIQPIKPQCKLQMNKYSLV